MKKINKFSLSIILTIFLLFGCTDNFEEFKADNVSLTKDDVSAKFFFTNTQTNLWMPATWAYLFTHSMYGPAYGGYSSYGYKNSWEYPDVLFNESRSWGASALTWNTYSNYFLAIDGFLRLVKSDGLLPNELMEAVGIIMKQTYYSTFTDLFGEVPYSQVGQEGVLTPVFDEQKDIYKGIITNLDLAMATIGSETSTGVAQSVDDLGEFDILFGGDLQKWKAFANGMKLRVALRAKGAPGEDFADAAITAALAAPLPAADVQIIKDLTVNWAVAAREGDFTKYNGSWKMASDRFVNLLRDNDDPRMPQMLDPIPGGAVTFGLYNDNKAMVDYILDSTLSRAAVPFTKAESGDDLIVTIDPGTYYVGMPMRMVDIAKVQLDPGLFSRPGRRTEGSDDIGMEDPQMIMSMAEVNFMKAEAALLGFGGDAQASLQAGITASFNQWGVSDNGYLTSGLATLSGSVEEQLQQLGTQAWIAYFMNDYQGFAIARDFNLAGITDPIPDDATLFNHTNEMGRVYPGRIKYGQPAYDLNGANVSTAVGRQGADHAGTQLWFAQGSKN